MTRTGTAAAPEASSIFCSHRLLWIAALAWSIVPVTAAPAVAGASLYRRRRRGRGGPRPPRGRGCELVSRQGAGGGRPLPRLRLRPPRHAAPLPGVRGGARSRQYIDEISDATACEHPPKA